MNTCTLSTNQRSIPERDYARPRKRRFQFNSRAEVKAERNLANIGKAS